LRRNDGDVVVGEKEGCEVWRVAVVKNNYIEKGKRGSRLCGTF